MIERLCIPLAVILMVLCFIVPVENHPSSYDCVSTCPTKITWRDLSCSSRLVYHTVLDPRSGRYIEGCFVPQWVPAGYVTILDNNTGNLNTEGCPVGTFQSLQYTSNDQCACNETKGHCNKTGQVVASNGNTTVERTCRCDFRRGYKLSTKPSKECVCNSSSEDCTCIKEECKTRYILSPGKATTLYKSGNINHEDCHIGTFQRSHYESYTQCACNETKGHCNKTGQVVASNGSTTEDRTCRCDSSRGYKFFIKPSNECVCQSSSENCTCIKEECETGYRMSPDYKCVLENLYSIANYTCKDYITSEENTTEYVPDSGISISLESTTESVSDSGISEMPTGMVQWYMTTIITICTALVFFPLGVLLESKYGIYESLTC